MARAQQWQSASVLAANRRILPLREVLSIRSEALGLWPRTRRAPRDPGLLKAPREEQVFPMTTFPSGGGTRPLALHVAPHVEEFTTEARSTRRRTTLLVFLHSHAHGIEQCVFIWHREDQSWFLVFAFSVPRWSKLRERIGSPIANSASHSFFLSYNIWMRKAARRPLFG